MANGSTFLISSGKQGTKELQLSLFQAIVVLLFNDTGDSSLSYKDIRQQSNIGILSTCVN